MNQGMQWYEMVWDLQSSTSSMCRAHINRSTAGYGRNDTCVELILPKPQNPQGMKRFAMRYGTNGMDQPTYQPRAQSKSSLS